MPSVTITGDFGPFINWLDAAGGKALLHELIPGDPPRRIYKITGAKIATLKQWAAGNDNCEVADEEPELKPHAHEHAAAKHKKKKT